MIGAAGFGNAADERPDLAADHGPPPTDIEHLCSDFTRQPAGGKDMVRVQRILDAVHHLPFRPGAAENIMRLLELDRCLFHDDVTAQLTAKVTQPMPHPARHVFKTGKNSAASPIQEQVAF